MAEKRASDLLHSMAASKDILLWTPCGQLLRNKRIITVTNITELVEYVSLPHNNEVTKPRALNTFLDGLAELGIDRGLITNKKLLSDLIEKEKGSRNVENTSENESNMRRVHRVLKIRRGKWLLRMAVKLKTPKRATTTLKTVREHKVIAMKRPPPFTLKIPLNIVRILMCTAGTLTMKCRKCSWHDSYKICPICDHQIPEERINMKEGFLGCYEGGAITHKTAKMLHMETTFYSPSKG